MAIERASADQLQGAHLEPVAHVNINMDRVLVCFGIAAESLEDDLSKFRAALLSTESGFVFSVFHRPTLGEDQFEIQFIAGTKRYLTKLCEVLDILKLDEDLVVAVNCNFPHFPSPPEDS